MQIKQPTTMGQRSFSFLHVSALLLLGFLVGHTTRPNLITPPSNNLRNLETQQVASPTSRTTVVTPPQQQQQLFPPPQLTVRTAPTTPKFLQDDETDPWKQDHFGRLDRVLSHCGPLCGINDLTSYQEKGRHLPGNAYSTFQTPVDCPALFELEEIDAGDTTLPYPIPPELVDWYGLHGAVPITYFGKLGDIYLNANAKENIWTQERIEEDLALLRNGQLKGTYGITETTRVRDRLMQQGGLTGQSVLVVGSQRPWLETIALYAGAAHVTTLEYGSITSHHPQVSTITPGEFRHHYLSGKSPQYDAVLSFSSLEHSGLGRYGDALNPWGDILSLARCWCVSKPNALLLLGVPVGPDRVEFNAHRVYGNVRMPLLTTNWVPADGTKTYEGQTNNLGLHFFRKQQEPSATLQ